jgi:ergothioneine biosynthesis protein EgtB
MVRSETASPFGPELTAGHPESLGQAYAWVREATEAVCDPLETEDYCVQSMPDVSPTKWHLAHTSWFFETFILEQAEPDFRPFHPGYRVLFNSYYNAVGPQHLRPQRGLLSRPTVQEIFHYRAQVDERIQAVLDQRRLSESQQELLLLGLHHEQQHQELMLMDIKHVFSQNPLRPAYRPSGPHSTSSRGSDWSWLEFQGGVRQVGHQGTGFAFDNEGPRHDVLLQPFRLQSRLVTNGEFIEFIEDGGYERPELWLSDGWATLQREGLRSPLYWEQIDGGWKLLTLGGMREVKPHAPVCHVSYFEADAFARWQGARLPTEQEWETAAEGLPIEGNFVEGRALHPLSVEGSPEQLRQMFGDAWEWTASPYVAYPGFEAPQGAVGEYNGKFMHNQIVLRGGSCVTPQSHVRASYRNFFPAHSRWMFSGFRLARDA